jgi:hypothetical protein
MPASRSFAPSTLRTRGRTSRALARRSSCFELDHELRPQHAEGQIDQLAPYPVDAELARERRVDSIVSCATRFSSSRPT